MSVDFSFKCLCIILILHNFREMNFSIMLKLRASITLTRPCNIQQYFTAVKMLIFDDFLKCFSYFCSKH